MLAPKPHYFSALQLEELKENIEYSSLGSYLKIQ